MSDHPKRARAVSKAVADVLISFTAAVHALTLAMQKRADYYQAETEAATHNRDRTAPAGAAAMPIPGTDHAQPSPVCTSAALPYDGYGGDEGTGRESDSEASSYDTVSDGGTEQHVSVCIGSRKRGGADAHATVVESYELTAAHYAWLVAHQDYQQGVDERHYDERAHTILQSIHKSGLALPDLSKHTPCAALMERERVSRETPRPIHRLWGQLQPSDFMCDICFVSTTTERASCTSFIRNCSKLSVDTERSPVRNQVSDDYSCHLVQLGTHRKVFLIPCYEMENDRNFAQALVDALAQKEVHFHGGDDNKRLARALGVHVSELPCTFVDMQGRFGGKGLADVAADTFPGRCLCKAWTNSGWDVFPLRPGQAEYAAMDVAVLHAIVEDAAAEGRNELHVCRLQQNVTSTQLKAKFSAYGTVTSAVKNTGQNFGYVTFANSHDARAALHASSTVTGIWIDGWRAHVAKPNRTGRRIW